MAESLPPVSPRSFARGDTSRSRHSTVSENVWTDSSKAGQKYRGAVDAIRSGDSAKKKADKNLRKRSSSKR